MDMNNYVEISDYEHIFEKDMPVYHISRLTNACQRVRPRNCSGSFKTSFQQSEAGNFVEYFSEFFCQILLPFIFVEI